MLGQPKQIRLGLAILGGLLVAGAVIGLMLGTGKANNQTNGVGLAIANSPTPPNQPNEATIPVTPGAPGPTVSATPAAVAGSNLSPAAISNPTYTAIPVVPPVRSPVPVTGSLQPPTQANEVFIVGTITTYDKPAGLVQLAQADGSNIAIKIGTSTTISRSGRAAASSDIKPGELISASGSFNNQGQLVATELRLGLNGSSRDPVSNPPRLPPTPTQPK